MSDPSQNAPPQQPFLTEFLSLQPVPCPACRCPLPPATTVACLNCKVQLTLGLASRDAYRVAWGVMLATLLIDAALGTFFAVVLLRIHRLDLRPSLWPPFILFMASIPMPLALLFLRVRFFRLSSWLQRTLLWLALGFTAAAFLSLALGLKR